MGVVSSFFAKTKTKRGRVKILFSLFLVAFVLTPLHFSFEEEKGALPEVKTNSTYAFSIITFCDFVERGGWESELCDRIKEGAENFGEKIFGPVLDFTVGNLIEGVANIIFILATWLLAAAGFFLEKSMAVTIGAAPGGSIYALETVADGWGIVRDIANIFFIFVLLYIAIATILQLDSFDTKRTLTRLIIIALLVNFSLFATRVVIDVSNVLAVGFYDQISQSFAVSDNVDFGVGALSGTTDTFMSSMGLQTIADFERAEKVIINDTKYTANNFDVAKVLLMGGVFAAIAAFVFLAAAIMLIIRTVVLIILMIFAPLAFLAWVLPGTQSYFTDWWNKLFNQAFFAPILFFMIYLSALLVNGGPLKAITGGGEGSLAGAIVISTTEGTVDIKDLAIVFHFAIVITLLTLSLTVARSMAGETANISVRWASKATGAVGGGMYRQSIGRLFHRLRTGTGAVGQSRAGQYIGGKLKKYQDMPRYSARRGLATLAEKAARGSGDIRGAGIPGVEGTAGGAGGFESAEEKRAEADAKSKQKYIEGQLKEIEQAEEDERAAEATKSKAESAIREAETTGDEETRLEAQRRFDEAETTRINASQRRDTAVKEARRSYDSASKSISKKLHETSSDDFLAKLRKSYSTGDGKEGPIMSDKAYRSLTTDRQEKVDRAIGRIEQQEKVARLAGRPTRRSEFGSEADWETYKNDIGQLSRKEYSKLVAQISKETGKTTGKVIADHLDNLADSLNPNQLMEATRDSDFSNDDIETLAQKLNELEDTNTLKKQMQNAPGGTQAAIIKQRLTEIRKKGSGGDAGGGGGAPGGGAPSGGTGGGEGGTQRSPEPRRGPQQTGTSTGGLALAGQRQEKKPRRAAGPGPRPNRPQPREKQKGREDEKDQQRTDFVGEDAGGVYTTGSPQPRTTGGQRRVDQEIESASENPPGRERRLDKAAKEAAEQGDTTQDDAQTRADTGREKDQQRTDFVGEDAGGVYTTGSSQPRTAGGQRRVDQEIESASESAPGRERRLDKAAEEAPEQGDTTQDDAQTRADTGRRTQPRGDEPDNKAPSDTQSPPTPQTAPDTSDAEGQMRPDAEGKGTQERKRAGREEDIRKDTKPEEPPEE